MSRKKRFYQLEVFRERRGAVLVGGQDSLGGEASAEEDEQEEPEDRIDEDAETPDLLLNGRSNVLNFECHLRPRQRSQKENEKEKNEETGRRRREKERANQARVTKM